MGISDMIAEFIYDALRTGGGAAELQRNDLANSFGCVPSQINYVIATRFTPERGYIVESKRGGGGYIKIRRVTVTKSEYLMHVVNSIGETLDGKTAQVFITNLFEAGIISHSEACIMLAAVSDRSLGTGNRDGVRAAVLKNMLLALLEAKSR